ncbi:MULTISPECIES: fumarylacetoacetate hydrolase family protein [unclassified Roseitalea]|uniref:fumarylacetoacetate hydrolase family protein n=1 Tax=unclassified Roseitalea TaxID=2639107 RepID=UPI00273DA1C2|nr:MULTISPECIES: fumarylacetoacetate hydrolase family protein [unclassified Roseitalea]
MTDTGVLIGRVWIPDVQGPAVVTVRDGLVVDITSPLAPLVRDVCEMADPVQYVREATGRPVDTLQALLAAPTEDRSVAHLLTPCDLQAIKACGVTFAGSMIERVIEERAAGDPAKAEAIRARVGAAIGQSLRDIRPGSPEALAVKAALIDEGLWSQYLEVGIGPDAEVFSKAQVLSAVGHGAKVGLHPASKWNNPEPELVLAVTSRGLIVGATLGNDVNLRDIEGRSALLLSKAKDNNASCAIGPFIRLFDNAFTLERVRRALLVLKVEGQDGFVLDGCSSMTEISRDPEDLVAQTIGRHHQYPDGLMLFLGTLFAPTEDRDERGGGFAHRLGDVVTITADGFGTLHNTVDLSTRCPEWTFGTRALMTNLASRNLI